MKRKGRMELDEYGAEDSLKKDEGGVCGHNILYRTIFSIKRKRKK